MKNKIFIGLPLKLTLGFTLIFTLVFAIANYWSGRIAQEQAMIQIREDLYRIIRGATVSSTLKKGDVHPGEALINGDAMEHLIKNGSVDLTDTSIYTPHTDDPLYWEQLESLCELIWLEPRAKPYTYIPGRKPDELIFITSYGWCLDDATTDDFATFRQSIHLDNVDANLAGMNQVVFQTDTGWCAYKDPKCIPEVYTDKYGSWVSAFAPIRNSRGDVVAVLGVDFTASYVNKLQKDVRDRIYIVFTVASIILVPLVFFVTQTLTRPMGRLTQVARQIGQGNYELSLGLLSDHQKVNNYPDEIDILSGAMKKMANDLQSQTRELLNSNEKMQELARLTIQAQETERRYYSRELHDQASQLLSTLKMRVQSIILEMDEKGIRNPSELRSRLIQIEEETGLALENIRRISHNMRPTLLDVGDFNLAFESHCNDFSQLSGIEVIYSTDENISMSDEVAISFFRFLQETFANVHKHAHSATRVTVRLFTDGGSTYMQVEDNGKSTTLPVSRRGIGLLGMKERFMLLGGDVSVESLVGGGYRVTATVPQISKNSI